MIQRIFLFNFRRKPYAVISILLLLHFSIIIFIANSETKEAAFPRTLLRHSNSQINNVSVNNLLLHRKKLVKFEARHFNKFNSISIKSPKGTDTKFINLRYFICSHYHELINTYIEFRPPPALLS